MIGFLGHLFYIVVLTTYIKEIYIDFRMENQVMFNTMIFFGMAYPAFYDLN